LRKRTTAPLVARADAFLELSIIHSRAVKAGQGIAIKAPKFAKYFDQFLQPRTVQHDSLAGLAPTMLLRPEQNAEFAKELANLVKLAEPFLDAN